MKKRIFIDTDVFLDVILQRKPFYLHSTQVINLCEKDEISGFASALIIANLYYILEKITSHKKAIFAINKIRAIVRILPVSEREIAESINAEFKDLEDGIQYFVANNHKISCIITRNTKDFKKSVLSVQTPKEFLQCIKT